MKKENEIGSGTIFCTKRIPNSAKIIKRNHNFKSSSKFQVVQEAIQIVWGQFFHYIRDYGFVIYDEKVGAYYVISEESTLHIISSSVESFYEPPCVRQICTPTFQQSYLRWFKNNHEISFPEGNQFLVAFRNKVYDFKNKKFVNKSPDNFCINVVDENFFPKE